MRDSADRPIAPFDLWRSSMMANAVRDPFWRAVVSAEMAATPSKADAIQAKCFSCHGAMASREGELDGRHPTLDMVYEDTSRGQILIDGVSCTICHQITEAGLGTDDSHTAHFVINARRDAYGPHADPLEMPMTGMSGYRPVQATQTTESDLCGSCHTVLTEALEADGTPTGMVFTEQTPYLEWRNSVFNDEVATPAPEAASCQACHMPTVSEDQETIRTAIATMMGGGMGGGGMGGGGMELREREPYGRHVLVGGNTVVPQMILEHADELTPNASAAALRATVAATRDALRHDTARLTLASSERDGDSLRLSLQVENLTGHKLPTGIPVRRAWIYVRVLDRDGALVFSSGAYDAAGRILGADDSPLPSEEVSGPAEPHQGQISDGNHVQIYEDVMADIAGQPTHRLMRAAAHFKDNRLLPLGWSAEHEDAVRTAPHGAAATDADFVGGRDDILYVVPAPVNRGPYQLEARLLYQALGQRFVAELLEFDTPEIQAFRRYYASATGEPEELSTLSVEFP
jgi:hypothetical protein